MTIDFSYYVIEKIENRRDLQPLNFQTSDILGQLCYIGYLQAGESAFINAIMKSDPSHFRCIRTSPVSDYHETGDGLHMTIFTGNRRYYLRRATSEEINDGLDGVKNKRLTVPVKGYGLYGT